MDELQMAILREDELGVLAQRFAEINRGQKPFIFLEDYQRIGKLIRTFVMILVSDHQELLIKLMEEYGHKPTKRSL